MTQTNSSVRVTTSKLSLAFAAVYIIWGSTYLAIRFGVESLPPFLMIGVRFMIGGTIFYAIARLRGGAKPALQHWRWAAASGILMIAGGTGMVAYIEQTVPSGLTALAIATVPMWVVLLDWIRPNGYRPGLRTIAGLLLGFAGVALLTGYGGSPAGTVAPFSVMLIMFGCASWAAGSLVSRNAVATESATVNLGMNMITGAGALIVVSLIAGEWSTFSISSVSLSSWLALVYQIVFGSLAYAAYVWLLKASTPAKAATYAFVNPVVALFLGSALAGEPFSSRTLLASIIIILGTAIIVIRRARRQEHDSTGTRPSGEPACEMNS
jgi:drug/metabolite transporter (DMT)-like permease